MNAARIDGAIALVCLVVLGALCGGAAMAAAGPLLVLAGFAPLVALVLAFNGALRARLGFGGAYGLLLRGFMMAVPFAALALASRYALGWQSGQAFAGAGIAAAGGAFGIALVKEGCGRLTGLLLPGLWSSLVVTAWMLTAGALAGVTS